MPVIDRALLGMTILLVWGGLIAAAILYGMHIRDNMPPRREGDQEHISFVKRWVLWLYAQWLHESLQRLMRQAAWLGSVIRRRRCLIARIDGRLARAVRVRGRNLED